MAALAASVSSVRLVHDRLGRHRPRVWIWASVVLGLLPPWLLSLTFVPSAGLARETRGQVKNRAPSGTVWALPTTKDVNTSLESAAGDDDDLGAAKLDVAGEPAVSAESVATPSDVHDGDSSLAFAAAVGAGLTALSAIAGPALARTGALALLQDGLAGLVQPFVDAYPIPTITLGLSTATLHWSHGGNAFAVLAAAGGLGISEGFAVRGRRLNGKGTGVNFHKAFMLTVLGYSLLSAASGLASMKYDQQQLLESPHAWSASIVLLLLLVNAAIGFGFKPVRPGDATETRSIHAQIGAAWIAAIVINAALGLGLGTSFEPATQNPETFNPQGNLVLDLSSAMTDPEFP